MDIELPLYIYLALGALALAAGGAIVLLLRLWNEAEDLRSRPRHLYSDEDWVEEIPEYPHPPVLVTRWGIHRDHVKRGHETEAGCPVCYDLGLHERIH